MSNAAAYTIRTETAQGEKEFRLVTYHNPFSTQFTELVRVYVETKIPGAWVLARVLNEHGVKVASVYIN